MNPSASLAGYLLAQEGSQAGALRRSAWSLLGLFFQGKCRACGRPVSSPLLGRLCHECWDSLPMLSQPRCPRCSLPLPLLTWKGREEAFCRDCRRLGPKFHRARALFPFKGFVREIIHDYKFSSATSLRRPLVRCLELAYGSASWEGAHDLLTHVPTSPEALRQRGFDHAAELAQGLSRRLNIPWVPVLAKKTGFKRQSDLSRASRLRNTREAFSVENAPGLEGRRILLVDDVLTTGATVQACSRAMLAAGAMSVDVLALARSV